MITLSEFQQLIKKLQDRDLSALEKIYNSYFGKIYSNAFLQLKDEQDAYDISMKVMEKLINYSGPANEIRNHVGLLMTMTNNAIKDFYRKKKFIIQYENCENLGRSELGDMLWLSDIVATMTEEEREIFIDHVIWGIELKSIAEKKHRSYITIRRMYHLIKKKISEIYKSET